MKDDFDPVLDTILQRASAAVEPEPARLARALDAVQKQLALPAPPELDPHEGGMLHRQAAAPAASKAAMWPTLSVLRMPLAFLAWGAVSGTIGFMFGIQQVRMEAPAVTAPVAAPDAPVTEEATSGLPASPAVPPGADRRPAQSAEPQERAPQPGSVKSRSAKPRAPQKQLGFRYVLDHVRRAERAQRQGDPALALALLRELDERADAGTLREERLVTRVLALCAQGETGAAQAAADEVASGDRTIYAGRLAHSCVTLQNTGDGSATPDARSP